MRKFIFKLFLLSVGMILIVLGMHAVAFCRLQGEKDRVYTMDPSTEILFIGSSQVMCSIDESLGPIGKLCVSDTITPSFLMRLKELERRNQLNNIKMIIVPFNIASVTAQTEQNYLWAWYQELPVAWRYMDLLPYSALRFALYIVCNLRCPLPMHIVDCAPDREGLESRPDRLQAIGMFERWARNVKPCGTSPEWESRLFEAYREMNRIALGRGIRFVVFKAPLLPQYESNLPENVVAKIEQYEQRFRDMGIEYISPDVKLDDRYFFDNVHLIKSGAKIFTVALFDKIESSGS